VKRTFDAAKVRYEVEGFWVDAFVSRPVVVWNNHFNQSDDQDQFSGIYASSTKLIPWQESQMYFLSGTRALARHNFMDRHRIRRGPRRVTFTRSECISSPCQAS